jgi:hypothetical protein
MTQHRPRGSHIAAKFQSQQPFRTKFMMSEKENCVQKSAEMFYTLISSFERYFPGNDQAHGYFLRFLTLNKSFGGWSPVCSSQQPLTYVRESGLADLPFIVTGFRGRTSLPLTMAEPEPPSTIHQTTPRTSQGLEEQPDAGTKGKPVRRSRKNPDTANTETS